MDVLLTAPARGYVKKGLDSCGVSYTHEILTDYRDLADCYHCLDLYLITSREEGGPKGILESLASGIPLVCTKVGMAPDVLEHGKDAMLADIDDVDSLVSHVACLIDNLELRRSLVDQGSITILDYDWGRIAVQYYANVYQPLIDE